MGAGRGRVESNRDETMPYEFSKIEDALEAMAEGRVVIVVDDEERENEGDFVAAAEKVTPETIEFMITHGRGQLCMPIMPELAERLELHPMVEQNTAPHQTPFTVPVDHQSCRTGISAEERARTVRAIIDPATKPADLVRPGHLFPLVAKEGGVLRRAGHTEATVDLARLAGLTPGRRALRDPRRHPTSPAASSCTRSPREFDLPIVSIEMLIELPPPPREAGRPRWPRPSCRPATARAGSSATASSTSRATSRSPS